ncbi:MAG: hypothetical protein HYU78_14445 [Rhodocyclales bacterium]|nr:hypothetical protein [Rhodocyclales bacterium]
MQTRAGQKPALSFCGTVSGTESQSRASGPGDREHLEQRGSGLQRQSSGTPPATDREGYDRRGLADIISLVKHAAKEASPIYTAEERVGHAMSQLLAQNRFSDEQLQWLQLIREHLVKNLTIELDDFDAPIFFQRGGLGKANKVFAGELAPLLPRINEALASA